MKKILNSREETAEFAGQFLNSLVPNTDRATVVGLYGDLGAGKTTFTQSLAIALGITERVVSPTFVIMKIYELTDQKWHKLVHIDTYRIEHSDELVRLHWQKIIGDARNLVVIEWPLRVADIMPKHVEVLFTQASENVREVQVLL